MIKFFRSLALRWIRAEASVLASSLAFNSVLVIVPLLAISLAIFHYIGGMESMLVWVESHLREYLIFGSNSFVIEKIEESVQRIHSGALGSFGIFFVFLTCSRLFWQFDTAVQKIWNSERQFLRWWQLAIFWGLVLIGPLSVSAIIGVVPVLLLEGMKIRVDIFFSYMIFYLLLLFLFKSLPNRPVAFRVAAGTAFLSLVALVLMKRFFVALTTDLMSYNRVYGSLAALPVFLIWVLVLWWTVLLSFAFCAQWQESITQCEAGLQDA